jgi:DNA polymerase-3 subunit delta
MKFSEFRQYQPKAAKNVFVFVCEDDFLIEESRPVWARIFGGNWQFEKMTAREFEDIPSARLADGARTSSLFATNRAFIVTNAEKVTKGRLGDLTALADVPQASLKIVLVSANRKSDSWSKVFPLIEIDALKPADVARWLVERYRLSPEIARNLVESVGTDLYQLHMEVEKLNTYVAGARAIDARDVDVLILRSEQFGAYELDDAVFSRDYRKAVQVIGAMLDEGMEPLLILARLSRVWRQLFVGKSLAGSKGARDVALAVMMPAWKAGDFVSSCANFEWKQLVRGFHELLEADRAFKSSTPGTEDYFDVMLWKMLGREGA